MHLTYAKMGITLEDSSFDFVRRVRMTMILAYSCSLTYLLTYFKKRLEGFLNELSHENLFMFMFSGWICLLCELNGGEGKEIK